jgi:hypothetical protein
MGKRNLEEVKKNQKGGKKRKKKKGGGPRKPPKTHPRTLCYKNNNKIPG